MPPVSERLNAALRSVGRMLLEAAPDTHRGTWQGDQLKTEIDRVAHAMLCGALEEIGLGIPVVSEEDPSGHADPRPDAYWLVDPIDGTRSLVEGFPGFVTQAALMEAGRPTVAGVYAPRFDALFDAVAGGGARLNGRPLAPVRGRTVRTLIDNTPQPAGMAAHVFEALKLEAYVETGSIGLKACRVADGTADLAFKDVTVRDWDLAPADLILTEVGGILRTISGEPFLYDGSFEKRGFIATTEESAVVSLVEVLNGD